MTTCAQFLLAVERLWLYNFVCEVNAYLVDWKIDGRLRACSLCSSLTYSHTSAYMSPRLLAIEVQVFQLQSIDKFPHAKIAIAALDIGHQEGKG